MRLVVDGHDDIDHGCDSVDRVLVFTAGLHAAGTLATAKPAGTLPVAQSVAGSRP
jgi:hypothetical protein